MPLEVDPFAVPAQKTGYNGVHIELYRGRDGVSVTVKAHPSIEDFMKSLGTGTAQPVEAFGRMWQPFREHETLLVYDFSPQQTIESRGLFDLEPVGGPLYNTSTDKINLSFLRLQGVTDGVRFRLTAPTSSSELARIRDLMTRAASCLWNEYLRPTGMVIKVIVSEP